MSAPKRYPRVPALCNECGQQRDVAYRTVAKSAWLKCSNCRRATLHAVVADPEWDYREEVNRKAAEGSEKLLAEYDRLMELFDQLDARVYDGWRGMPLHRHAWVVRYHDDDGILVMLRRDLTLQGKVELLRWAWGALASSRLTHAPVQEDDDRGRWQGIYRTCRSCEERKCCDIALAPISTEVADV